MTQRFFAHELLFTSPDEISKGIDKWFEENPGIDEIISVNNYITAVQAPSVLAAVGSQSPPQVQYQFRFVIIYC